MSANSCIMHEISKLHCPGRPLADSQVLPDSKPLQNAWIARTKSCWRRREWNVKKQAWKSNFDSYTVACVSEIGRNNEGSRRRVSLQKLFSSSFLPSSYVLDLVKSRVDVAQCLDGLLIISRSSEFVDCAVFPVDQSVLSFLYRRWKIDCWVPRRGKMRKWPPYGDRYRMQKWNIPR